MRQLINKKKIYFYLFLFLTLTTISNKNFFSSFSKNFLIKSVKIETQSNEIKKKIISKTGFLLNKNIFTLKKNYILDNLDNINYLENIKITKYYPSTIIIKAQKTELIAITYIDQEKYYVGSNGLFVSAKKISSKKKLPIIFGQFNIQDYIILKEKLKKKKILIIMM